ncbi:hypothetical protein ANN_26231 [Periplaneta americana]|uniref:Tc1-like transposase DDE domain-containing protein n=1 Tax=Periplaneta americana TaxID=6978 RepID=A0ABQ8S5M6_PERAM|nr:hypothetical protein ANN_26231 [Periplaneta americana]
MRPEDVARAVALYGDGHSVRYIANVINMARSTTHDAIKRYRETLEYTRSPGSSRPRATKPNEDRDWRNGQWSCVLFTDESRFNLCSPDGRERVWRRRGERFSQCCISENVPYGGGGVMVWAGVCTDARTELVFVENGRLTADRYINECLADHIVPFGQFVGDNFVLMHDNARPHIAHAVGDYLQEVGIHVLPWPARSPDMNPIEQVWDMLGRRVKNRRPRPESLQKLRRALGEEWELIPQEDIANQIESMPRRMDAVIQARGAIYNMAIDFVLDELSEKTIAVKVMNQSTQIRHHSNIGAFRLLNPIPSYKIAYDIDYGRIWYNYSKQSYAYDYSRTYGNPVARKLDLQGAVYSASFRFESDFVWIFYSTISSRTVRYRTRLVSVCLRLFQTGSTEFRHDDVQCVIRFTIHSYTQFCDPVATDNEIVEMMYYFMYV